VLWADSGGEPSNEDPGLEGYEAEEQSQRTSLMEKGKWFWIIQLEQEIVN
jgi:hypothetical protein